MGTFTSGVPGFEIIINIRIDGKSLAASANTSNMPVSINALVDTGATLTVIENWILQQLNVLPVDVIQVDGIGGSQWCGLYIVNLLFPDHQTGLLNWRVVGVPRLNPQYQCLIGMDILKMGESHLDGVNNLFTLGFPEVEQ